MTTETNAAIHIQILKGIHDNATSQYRRLVANADVKERHARDNPFDGHAVHEAVAARAAADAYDQAMRDVFGQLSAASGLTL